MIFPQEQHLTRTSLVASLSNFLEPHFGQTGQARNGFIVI
jgi:hypothetical protein